MTKWKPEQAENVDGSRVSIFYRDFN